MRLNTLIAAVMVAVASTAAYAQEVSICDYPVVGYNELVFQVSTVRPLLGSLANDSPELDAASFMERYEPIIEIADAFSGFRRERTRDGAVLIPDPMLDWMLSTEMAIRLLAATVMLTWSIQGTDTELRTEMEHRMGLLSAIALAGSVLLTTDVEHLEAWDEWEDLYAEAGCG